MATTTTLKRLQALEQRTNADDNQPSQAGPTRNWGQVCADFERHGHLLPGKNYDPTPEQLEAAERPPNPEWAKLERVIPMIASGMSFEDALKTLPAK